MARQRLTLFAVVLTFVAGATVWRYSSNWLTADERLLVGTWQERDAAKSQRQIYFFEFLGDRRWHSWAAGVAAPAAGGRWAVRDGQLVLDSESNVYRRWARPVVRRLNARHFTIIEFSIISLTANEVIGVALNGNRFVLSRTAADSLAQPPPDSDSP